MIDHHKMEKGRVFPVCGKPAVPHKHPHTMLTSRLAIHFLTLIGSKIHRNLLIPLSVCLAFPPYVFMVLKTGNTNMMLQATRFAKHFEFIGVSTPASHS